MTWKSAESAAEVQKKLSHWIVRYSVMQLTCMHVRNTNDYLHEVGCVPHPRNYIYDPFPLLEHYCVVVCTTKVAIVAILGNLRSVLLDLTDSTNLVKF